LIYSPSGRRVELYDLRTDPEETKDLSSENKSIVRELRDHYDRMVRDSRDLAANFELRDGGAPELDEKTLEELRALGYIQ
jgi:hypothetical protein